MTSVEAIVARARLLRELASSRSGTERVEVYCKESSRVRASRGVTSGALEVSFANESGMAVRIGAAAGQRSAFASVGGRSRDAMRWAVDTAVAAGEGCGARMLSASEVVGMERLDLDPSERLPASERLKEWIQGSPSADWIEAGVTVETLCGDSGWVAVRRRARSWALFDRTQPALAARREAAGWELPEPPGSETGSAPFPPGRADARTIILLPEAAAPLVTALATVFHGEGSRKGEPVGVGWCLEDDPLHLDGVCGGQFDDAGFPSARSTLAEGGRVVGILDGPGTYRRPSFRDAPTPGISTIRVLQDPPLSPPAGLLVRRCRVLPLEVDSWALELDGADLSGGSARGETWSLRADPRRLILACTGPSGVARLTGEGVLTPSLVFEGLD